MQAPFPYCALQVFLTLSSGAEGALAGRAFRAKIWCRIWCLRTERMMWFSEAGEL